MMATAVNSSLQTYHCLQPNSESETVAHLVRVAATAGVKADPTPIVNLCWRARIDPQAGEEAMDIRMLFLIVIGIIVVLVILDLILAGGAMTMGMMSGMVGMMSNPIGQGILLILLAILGVLVYAVFFR